MTNHIKVLPNYLIKRYKRWKITGFEENKSWYNKIADEGQNPKAMVISCCDARVHVTSMFGADTGEFFIHRNIANLVPPYNYDDNHHGTSAAIEYAVRKLKVLHIIVLGHSNCGGITSAFELFKNLQIYDELFFVNKWLNILKPAYNNILNNSSNETLTKRLEKESIKISLNNLMHFPFIQKVLDEEKLILHGLWHDIGSGVLEMLESESGNFIKI